MPIVCQFSILSFLSNFLLVSISTTFCFSTVYGSSCSLRFVPSDVIHLNQLVSSSIFNNSRVTSSQACMLQCRVHGCNLLSWNSGSQLCQLVVLNDADSPPETFVSRVIGGAAGDRVWKASDFESQLQRKLRRFVMKNTGNGSTGTIQSAVIPVTACYRIEATGAKGGATHPNFSPILVGGKGARMSGNFSLTAATQLTIVVGQSGGNASQAHKYAGAGGGGGSFVYVSANNSLLLAAGGGGGGCAKAGAGMDGQSSVNGTDTPTADIKFVGYGGANGQPGIVSLKNTETRYYFGGAGAGWLGKCNVSQRTSMDALSGGSRADGWVGGVAGSSNSGAVGGFGGGGGGGGSNGGSDSGGGGGGGAGFSGGGAGVAYDEAGGGGGSFCGGAGCLGVTGGNTDGQHGSVVIQAVGYYC